MNLSRNNLLPIPDSEIVELHGNSGRAPGNPIQLQPGGGSLQIVDAAPSPRLQLEVVLQLDPKREAAHIALSTARFCSTIQETFGNLRLIHDPILSTAREGIVTLVFRIRLLGSRGKVELDHLSERTTEAAVMFEGAALLRTSVAARS